jgi:hypothetical protein
MTPKEKAKQLTDKMHQYAPLEEIEFYSNENMAKQCALIAVDECINIHFNLESDRNGIGESFKYWQEVRQEIEKL